MPTPWSPRNVVSTEYGSKKVELYYLCDQTGEKITDENGDFIMIFGEAWSGIPYNNAEWGDRNAPADTPWSERSAPSTWWGTRGPAESPAWAGRTQP